MDCPICLQSLSLLETPIAIQCGHVFHKDCVQLLNNSTHHKTKTQCPLCRESIQSIIPLFLNFGNSQNKGNIDSQSIVTFQDSQSQQNSKYNHKDTLIKLNTLLSEKIHELEQSQKRIKLLQSEHTILTENLTKKHDTSLRKAQEEYEILFDTARRQGERLEIVEKLNTKLTNEVERLNVEMEDFKTLRVCTLVQNMIKQWDKNTLEDHLRGEKDLITFARALSLQNRLQFEEMNDLQSQLSQVKNEKQILERRLFKVHSEDHVIKCASDLPEKEEPFSTELPIIRNNFGHSIVIKEPERIKNTTGPLFRTKRRQPVGSDTFPDGMGGRSKIIRNSTNSIIDL